MCNILCLYISAPLFEASCSKDYINMFNSVRCRSKAYVPVCIASEPTSMLAPAGLVFIVLRTTTLLPKVAIYINIKYYTIKFVHI